MSWMDWGWAASDCSLGYNAIMVPWMRRFGCVAVLAALGLAAAACAPAGAGGGGGKKRVVATFTIIADMAREIAGDAADVTSITKPGAEIHEYEPTPGDLVRAQGADLLIDNGLGLERWFERFHRSLGTVKRVIVSEGVEPLGIGEGPYSGKPNPHAWMSPKNAAVYARNIHKALCDLDAKNQSTYSANLAAYLKRLEEVDAFMKEELGKLPADQRVLVSSEGAFTYLCRDYGMKEMYLWPVNADQEGTPDQVKKVIDGVRASGVRAVFSESTISDKPMRQVAKETGARYGGVLYVDSLTDDSGPAPQFLALLAHNAHTIVRGLRGDGVQR